MVTTQRAVAGHEEASVLAEAHQRAMDTLQRAVRESHTEWAASMDASVLRGLTQPLLATGRGAHHAILRVAMDPALHAALTEV